MIEAVKQSPVDVVAEWERGSGVREPMAVQEPEKIVLLNSELEAVEFIDMVCYDLVGVDYRNRSTFDVVADTTRDGKFWVTVKGGSEGLHNRIMDRRVGWTAGRIYEAYHYPK